MKLSEWLADAGVSPAQLATACKVHPVTVYKWRAGTIFPRPSQLEAIIQATQGAVTADDFMAVASAKPQASPQPKSLGLAEAQAPFVQEARALGLDAEAIAAAALKKAIGDEKARRWAEENREAIQAWHRYFEDNDTPLAEYRMF